MGHENDPHTIIVFWLILLGNFIVWHSIFHEKLKLNKLEWFSYQHISITQQSNEMKLHHFVASVDTDCLGVDDANRLDIIQAFVLPDYEDEEKISILGVIFGEEKE